jgi:alpha-D-xyloside xylohydrolase
MFYKEDDRLRFHYDAEELYIEPWGGDALRVRATKQHTMPLEDWALQKPTAPSKVDILITEDGASIINGKIKATISSRGKIVIFNHKGKLLLEEYARHRLDLRDPKCSSLSVEAREFKPIPGGDYHLTMRFESIDKNEKIYGMGQYQQPYLDLKGLDIELAQRNSQASVPFALSSLGYGFLWNNPAVGRAVLGKNIMSFEAYSTKVLDYWVVAGDTPAKIEEAYAKITGTVPMMPEYGLGFWQCKLRYQTQEELLGVAREYKKRDLPIDLIVIDFFHWPLQGEWKFDPTYWPDPGECLLFILLSSPPSEQSTTFADSVADFVVPQNRGHDRRTPHPRHRAHGIYLAHRRQTLPKLPGYARGRPPRSHRPWHPHDDGLYGRHGPL